MEIKKVVHKNGKLICEAIWVNVNNVFEFISNYCPSIVKEIVLEIELVSVEAEDRDECEVVTKNGTYVIPLEYWAVKFPKDRNIEGELPDGWTWYDDEEFFEWYDGKDVEFITEIGNHISIISHPKNKVDMKAESVPPTVYNYIVTILSKGFEDGELTIFYPSRERTCEKVVNLIRNSINNEECINTEFASYYFNKKEVIGITAIREGKKLEDVKNNKE